LIDPGRVNQKRKGSSVIEVTPVAERDWVEHVNLRARETLYPKAESYYVGVEIPGKPRVFMPYSGGVRAYRRTLERIAAGNYDGFRFGPVGQGRSVTSQS
jgi:hypothetical protein